jgi:acetolactate synthase small subunit
MSPASDAWSTVGQTARIRFDILAEQQPGLLPRLLAPFARRDLSPDSLHAERAEDGMMRVRIALDAVPAEQAPGIEGNLRQVVGVQRLLVQREVTGLVRRVG